MCRPIQIRDANRLQFHPLRIRKPNGPGELAFETGYQPGLPTRVFDRNLDKDKSAQLT